MRKAGGIAVMVLVVGAKFAHAFYSLHFIEHASVAAYHYVTSHSAHKLSVDPKDGRKHSA